MYDHQTGSYWWQVLGEAIVGPRVGDRLTLLASVTISWSEWRRQHPDTLVLRRVLLPVEDPTDPSGMAVISPYDRQRSNTYELSLNEGRFPFPVSKGKLDTRLKFADLVLAVQVQDSNKAYLMSSTADWVHNDMVGDESIVVIGRSRGPTAAAYFSILGDQHFSFSPNPPKDTDGRREGSGRGWVREVQGRWPGVLG